MGGFAMYKDDKEFCDSFTKEDKRQVIEAMKAMNEMPIEIEDIDEEVFLDYYESYAFLEGEDYNGGNI